jgi:hypothetical protein
VGWSSQRWELYEYPDGWTVPAGWTEDSTGVYFSTAFSPPSFELPDQSLWGKLLPRLIVNVGSPGATGVPASQLTDTATVVTIPSLSGTPDVAYLEGKQFDARRGWVAALKGIARTIDTAINEGVFGLENLFNVPFQFGPFTVATLPDAVAHAGGVISVTDGNNGGPCLARSNGTDWLRVELGQAVSTAAPEAPTLTIASGAVTVTPGIYVFRLDTEGAGASDDLTSINGMVPGRIYTFTSVDSARVIVMKNSVGNLQLAGADFTIDLSLSMIQLMVVGGAAGTGARELSRSTNTIT